MELVFDEIVKTTDRAYLVEFGDVIIWIPKSLVANLTQNTITLPEGFVDDNELEYYED